MPGARERPWSDSIAPMAARTGRGTESVVAACRYMAGMAPVAALDGSLPSPAQFGSVSRPGMRLAALASASTPALASAAVAGEPRAGGEQGAHIGPRLAIRPRR